MFLRSSFCRVAAAGVGAWLALGLPSATASAPSIVITNLPAYGSSSGNLSGLVLNTTPATHAVLVFIYVAGGWYSKPSCASQLTAIQSNGSWTADITTGTSDKYATEVAAFLVSTNYSLACVNGSASLTIPSQAEAVVYANRLNPSSRHFTFSDYGWSVKTSSGSLAGPGPNYFSDSTNTVWLDAQGALHLKINYQNGGWQCAEVISDRSFGYGQYRFSISAPVSVLGSNTVLGMFTWSNDSAYNDREIDIEMSRWGYSFGSTNVANYAISPYGTGQVLRFGLPATATNTTHSFIWQSNSIAFRSLNGGFSASPAASNILQSWTNSTAIPAGGEQVRINLWLNHGTAPDNGQPVEVVISNFTFVPLGTPPSATLGRITGLTNGPVEVNVQSMADYHYQILSSSNLTKWTSLGTVLATNSGIAFPSLPVSFQFTDTNTVSSSPRFYRALTQP